MKNDVDKLVERMFSILTHRRVARNVGEHVIQIGPYAYVFTWPNNASARLTWKTSVYCMTPCQRQKLFAIEGSEDAQFGAPEMRVIVSKDMALISEEDPSRKGLLTCMTFLDKHYKSTVSVCIEE